MASTLWWRCHSLVVGLRRAGSLVATLWFCCGLGCLEFNERLITKSLAGRARESQRPTVTLVQDLGDIAQPKSFWEALRPHEWAPTTLMKG